jgi:hypothetical protein
MRQLGRRDPGPGIAHHDVGLAAFGPRPHRDPIAAPAELDRVAEEVGEHLEHAIGIIATYRVASSR